MEKFPYEELLDDLVSIAEMADYLPVSKSFCYKLVRQGKITAIRFGRSVWVSKAGIQEYIEQHIIETYK